ncbi:MAG: sigma-70 family RNA polymerase sigma factor [Ruminococcus flavefaciens]|nr:sigma-70 family RNA polymerase sigma factor [Ruminococcus flavefaciens]
MEDHLIIQEFYERSERAIQDLSDKYGTLCHTIAKRILGNKQDAEECVNDALLAAWNTIPPEQPDPLSTYICRITRNISLNKYHANTAQKRNHYYDLVLDELEQTLVGNASVEDEILAKELEHAINGFLSKCKQNDRIIFIKRYWFFESITKIADSLGKSRNYVTVHLHRSRKKLKQYLTTRGLIE